MKIAHISDLHFTGEMEWPPRNAQTNLQWAAAYLELERDLKLQKPELLFVTGDIANNDIRELKDNGLQRAWAAARSFLESLCNTLRLDPRERLFVIPGNHDVKVLGNVTREQLLDLTGSWLYRLSRGGLRHALKRIPAFRGFKHLVTELEVLDDPIIRDALKALATDRQAFTEAFTPYVDSRYVPKLDLYVLCVDSNTPDDPLSNFAQGAVCAAEAKRIHDMVEEWQRDPQYGPRYKIALVHHHPMPVPLAEGINGLLEEDRFHLMRNAGNFLRLCIDAEVDLILHGHKHAHGYSTVSLPRAARAERPQSIAIVGAGSVHVPFNGKCSYNILVRERDRSWSVQVRSRHKRDEGISRFEPENTPVMLMSSAEYRWREWNRESATIAVGRMDVLAVIDDTGDVELRFSATEVRPLADEELHEYPTQFTPDSRRATIEDATFEDTDPSLNRVKGLVRLSQPATRDVARDVDFSFTVVGMMTFSREYCQAYKNQSVENFTFGIGKRYESLNVDVEFPLEFPPLRPRIEVMKIAPDADLSETTPRLAAAGQADVDVAETAYCRSRLRAWAEKRRLSIQIDRPLPRRDYRLVWDLPVDEFEIIPDGKMRASIRAAVKRFKEIASNSGASAERAHVHAFLHAFGDAATNLVTSPATMPMRVDLSIRLQGPLTLVAAAARNQNGWLDMSSAVECELGETARGRAYLERRVVSFSPGDVENKRSPVHHEAEPYTQHQIAIPLLWPPEPLYYPRVGVVTLSCDDVSSPLFDKLSDERLSVRLFELAHEHLNTLSKNVGCPLPEFTPAD